MKLKFLWLDGFKNFKDYKITFDNDSNICVFAGDNGTGKSNIFEALIEIFRSVEYDQKTDFSYKLWYRLDSNRMVILSYTKDHDKLIVKIDGKDVLKKNHKAILPKNIFLYYSGDNKRINFYLDEYEKSQYEQHKKGLIIPLRKMFMLKLIHAKMILLVALVSNNIDFKKILSDELNIIDFSEVKITLKKPYFYKSKLDAWDTKPFWGAIGRVRYFLDDILKNSINTEEVSYIQNVGYFPDTEEFIMKFRRGQFELIYGFYGPELSLFNELENIYICDLLKEINIKLIMKDTSEIDITQLSEGELQLILIKGWLYMIQDLENSLMLFDEPETHLNPKWKLNYLVDMQQILKSQFAIINTHDPLLIGNLRADQIYIFKHNFIPQHPNFDPKGLGINGILMSDIFELNSVIDKTIEEKMTRRRALIFKQYNKIRLTPEEKTTLNDLNVEIGNLGFTSFINDPLYNKFLKLLSKEIDIAELSSDKLEQYDHLFQKIKDQLR